MKNESIIWIILAIVALALIASFGFGGYGGYGGMMGGYGSYGSGMMFFGWLYGILILIALVLFIMWLAKQIQK